MICMMTFLKRYACISSLLFMVACSTSKPAPIKDQSTPINPAKSVVTPNKPVINPPKPIANAATTTKQKTAATETKPIETKPAETKQNKAAIETPPPKTELVLTDPGFRIGKPSTTPVIDGFNGNTNKGIDYGGKIGDPISAASDGKVIFSGNSLRSYGNLVIVKHNNNYITIYAHNSKNLVREGDIVKRGEKIAEMGNTESDRVKLHFELRRDSKPIDPAGYFDS
jgi:lipoprotein NlpD